MPQEPGPVDENSGKRLTPVMEQYLILKGRCGDSILFFQIGDFYETFWSDAETVSRELDIVLTSRSKGSGGEKIPLAGVPCHAFDSYVSRLVRRGYRVAIVDQVGNPRDYKGVVKRELTRIISPGTVIDPSMVTSHAAVYLMAVAEEKQGSGITAAFLDITTGEFFYTLCNSDDNYLSLGTEVAKYRPGECIISPSASPAVTHVLREKGVLVTRCEDETFSYEKARDALLAHFHVASLEGYGLVSRFSAVRALGAALLYAKETQGQELPHITGFSDKSVLNTMVLDAVTLRNLEILSNIRDGGDEGTLRKMLDLTITPMGSRVLARCITNPLLSPERINDRLDGVEYFYSSGPGRASLRELLAGCSDIARIAGRVSYGNAGPRDLVSLAASLERVPRVSALFGEDDKNVPPVIREAVALFHDHSGTVELIRRGIMDDPPAIIRNGMVIREGFDAELDEFRLVSGSGKDWIGQLQQEEREKTGIKSLKVGYNSVFGYYIEVSKPNLPLVPPEYERKQTTSTGERFTIPSLREKEASIAHAEERLIAREIELYQCILSEIRPLVPGILSTAEGIGQLDYYAALAEAARRYQFARPRVNPGCRHIIRDARHPVVEQRMRGEYIPNDVRLDGSTEQVLIITGANMAGKSTYMRSVALITILAQMGSYVPASYAEIGVVDRIFTRVGAFDDLALGQSTFMVEMIELANILNNVTKNSLVILDEIGRGTSTLDGFCIAKAVLEFLHGRGSTGPRTLFATHFHEIVGIDTTLPRVRNCHFAVRETGNEVIFLRKIVPGATDRSYGIHVARIAGVPRKVADRAQEIMAEAEEENEIPGKKIRKYTQMLLFDAQEVKRDPLLEELAHLPVDTMTPLDALVTLHSLKTRAKAGKDACCDVPGVAGQNGVTSPRDNPGNGTPEDPGTVEKGGG